MSEPYLPITIATGGHIRMTYPPGTLLLVAPFVAAFHDLRWAYLLAQAAGRAA